MSFNIMRPSTWRISTQQKPAPPAHIPAYGNIPKPTKVLPTLLKVGGAAAVLGVGAYAVTKKT